MAALDEKVTLLLSEAASGDREAWTRLLGIVYRELHTLARRAMHQVSPGRTLQTTALVNEAYLRLVRNRDEGWKNRGHFFQVAAKAMRQVLVDQYRRSQAAKRGSGERPVPLEDVEDLSKAAADPASLFENLEALEQALDTLGGKEEHKRKCTLVELHFFVGLNLQETADGLGISLATAKRDWQFARAWLCDELKDLIDHER